jgi:hypothetical protein
MQLITDVKKLRTAIDGALRSATKLQGTIHIVACSALAHAEQHGDFGLLARLVFGLPTGQRVKTIQKWARMFSPVKFDEKAKKCVLDRSEKAVEWDVDGAIAMPYFEIVEQVASKPLTLQDVLDYLSKKAKAKDNDTAEIAETRKVIAKIHGFAAVLASPIVQEKDAGDAVDAETATEDGLKQAA